MQINIVSEPIVDKSSKPGYERWYPALILRTAKKSYADIIIWQAGWTDEDWDEAERQGFQYLTRYLDRVLR